MHKQGYNYFNINRLTYAELDALTEAHNRDVDNQRRAMEKSSKKGKKR